jgi:hypothetical protein
VSVVLQCAVTFSGIVNCLSVECKGSVTVCVEIQRYCALPFGGVTLFVERSDCTYRFCGEYLQSVGRNLQENVSNGSRECRRFII